MLSINVSELILTFVSFFIMLLLLKKFLFNPLLTFMDERQARIDAGIAKEKELEGKLLAAEEEQKKALEAVKVQAHEDEQHVMEQDNEALARAQKVLQDEMQKAEAHLSHEKQLLAEKSEAELIKNTAELSSVLADRLLGE